MTEYLITKHLRERYAHRFFAPKEFARLNTCCTDNINFCGECQKKHIELRKFITQNFWDINSEIKEKIKNSKEERSFLNNSNFMAQQYATYGYDRKFTFLVNKNIVFLILQENGKNIAKTCLDDNSFICQVVKKRQKFKKKEASNEILYH